MPRRRSAAAKAGTCWTAATSAARKRSYCIRCNILRLGQHPAAIVTHLSRHGIHIRAARTAALIDLAAQLPLAVLASLLGLAPATAERWSRRIASDWATYLHARAQSTRTPPVARRAALAKADVMRFPRRPPTRRLSPARTPHPWDPPRTEFPGIVPINTLQFGQSGDAAVAITGISAYSNGFEIFVTRLIRPGAPGLDDDAAPGASRNELAAREPFLISLRLSNGRKVISGRPHDASEPAGPILRPRGGGGTSHYQLSQWWAWPLPPSGPLEFICHWPALGTGESRVRIDAQVILDAARRSIRPWPGVDS